MLRKRLSSNASYHKKQKTIVSSEYLVHEHEGLSNRWGSRRKNWERWECERIARFVSIRYRSAHDCCKEEPNGDKKNEQETSCGLSQGGKQHHGQTQQHDQPFCTADRLHLVLIVSENSNISRCTGRCPSFRIIGMWRYTNSSCSGYPRIW